MYPFPPCCRGTLAGNRSDTSFRKQASGFPSPQHRSLMALKAAVTEPSCSGLIWGLYLRRVMSILQESRALATGREARAHGTALHPRPAAPHPILFPPTAFPQPFILNHHPAVHFCQGAKLALFPFEMKHHRLVLECPREERRQDSGQEEGKQCQG